MAATRSNPTKPEPKAKKPRKKRAEGERGRVGQIIDIYKMTKVGDPNVTWWMLLGLLGPIVVGLAIGILVNHWIYSTFVGLAVGLIVATLIFSRRAERAAYTRIAGQQGASLAAMKSVRGRSWNVTEEPVAMDARSGALVFRAVGKPGITLVAEGPHSVCQKLLTKETRKIARLLPNVQVHTMIVGEGSTEVPLTKIVKKMDKPKNSLTATEVTEIGKRLAALPSPVRNAIPKGVDPMRARPNRKAMRGR